MGPSKATAWRPRHPNYRILISIILCVTSLLGVRARRGLEDTVAPEEALFTDIGCASCHRSTVTTSPYHPYAELRSQTIHPYTDLLLHDMGPELADSLGEVSRAVQNGERRRCGALD